MKNKKLFARIGAILACVLLVGALAVPCFADVEIPDDKYLDISRAYSDYLPSGLQAAFVDFEAMLGEKFYNMSYFSAGGLFTSDQYYFERSSADLDIFVDGFITRNNVYVNVSYQGAGPTLDPSHPYVAWCYFEWSVFTDHGDSTFMLWVTCKEVDTNNEVFTVRYSADVNEIELGLYQYTLSVDSISSPLFTATEVLNPTWLYVGICSSYVDIYTSFVSTYLLGGAYSDNPSTFVSAYLIGEQAGYENGYNDGETSVDETAAYKEGYNKAVSEIDSGEFGRNFLGNFFNAPLSALSDFVLVELPALDEGLAPLRITLGGVVYLIIGLTLTIWFLRVVRG